MNNIELITSLLYLMSMVLFIRSGYLLALLVTFGKESNDELPKIKLNTAIVDNEKLNIVHGNLASQYLDEQLISILQTFYTELNSNCQLALIDSKGRLFTKIGNDDKSFAILGSIYHNLQVRLLDFLPNKFNEVIFHELIGTNTTITKHIIPLVIRNQQFYCVACYENDNSNQDKLENAIQRLSQVLMND